jgi:hypothetical protein
MWLAVLAALLILTSGGVLAVDTSRVSNFVIAEGTIEAGEDVSREKCWTVGMYWAGDNDLDGFTETFFDMWAESLVNRAEIGLAVFADRLDSGATISTLPETGWVVEEDLGEVNSSSPSVLADFIDYFMSSEELRAQHYMLIVQSHGLGYLGLCVDESEPGRPWMSIDGLGRALDMATEACGRELDIVDLDACSLGTVEVAYELREKASYLVASQLAVPFDGLNYRALLRGLSDNPDISPIDLACKMVDDYEEWYSAPLGTYLTLYPYMQDFATLSVIDLDMIGAVGGMFAELSNEILPKDGRLARPLNTAAQHHFVALWMNNMGCGFTADVRGMFEEVAEIVRDSHPIVAELCDDIVTAASDAIVKDWASWRLRGRITGLSVFVPSSIGIFEVNWDSWERIYGNIGLDFSEDSEWDDVILSYFCTQKQLGYA